MKPTPTPDDAALIERLRNLVDNQTGGDALVLVQLQLFNKVVGRLSALSAALSAQPATAVVGEAVAYLFEGAGWGKELMFSHQEALDRKERLSGTWNIEITPLYADPPTLEGWQSIDSAPISNGSNRFLVYIIGHGCCICYKTAAGFIYSVASLSRIDRATHWRPLPSPPSTHSSDKGSEKK